ncbi:MAG TPA: DNA (cytosine-5-)-methyltransferase [Aggregatilineales bacterium]|nr:DNA (cytosine-5-)-methyltransferase [Anaerolineales bacterium]HRE46748.1 DNA (cytosine-5-)-methyltransferase [Aggregatilineales bacterium]
MDKPKTITNHQARKAGVTVLSRIQALKIGQKMQDLPEALWHDSFRFYVNDDPTRQGGPNLRMIRLDPDQPSLTVTGYIYNKFVHPFEDRFITPREAARLQGFPDDLEFKGTVTSVQQQVGDAVPIELGRALFDALLRVASNLVPKQAVFSALSLFSGAGGLDVAAHQVRGAGSERWQTVACVEHEKDRCATLRGYFGDTMRVFQEAIERLSPRTILEACGVDRSAISLIYGGPPCQAFSQAGKQQGTYDPRGELIFEFLRFVEDISPPLFLMENVSNLKAIAKGKLLETILHRMDQLGYDVDHRVLNSAYYGNAQKRHRLIFFGTKKGLDVQASLPEPTHSRSGDLFGRPPFKTVRQAFEGLPAVDND